MSPIPSLLEIVLIYVLSMIRLDALLAEQANG
ncbi:hypothetical protein ABIA61_003669 [Paenibacillus sp. RC21]